MKKRFIRLLSVSVIVMTIVLLSAGATVWAGPSQQGTIPAVNPVATDPPGNEGWFASTGTGTAAGTGASIPPGGNATVDEQSPAELGNLGAAPAGQQFAGNGLDLQINDASGNPVAISFPVPPGFTGTIRQWDTTLTPPRWVSFPTTIVNGIATILTRLPGTYAFIGTSA